MISRIEKIGPKEAAEMSRGNNRPVRAGCVERYAADMANGKWRVTHQGIAIDKNGYVIDGQHRLDGIIKSGATIEILVTRGLEPENFDVIDSGSARTCSDSFVLEGMNRRTAKLISSAIPYISGYENYKTINKNISRAKGSVTLFVRDYYERNKSIKDSAEFVQTLPYRDSLLKQSLICFLHYIISRHYNDADEFISLLATGDGVSSDSVIFEMRKFLLSYRIKTSTASEQTIVRRCIATYNYYHEKTNLRDWNQALRRINHDTEIVIK